MSRFLVHFFGVHCTTTTWNLLIAVLWRTWTYDDEFSFLFFSFLNQNKMLKNSTLGKVACIWHIERVQINAIKLERTQIHFFTDVFTVVVVVVLILGSFSNDDGYGNQDVKKAIGLLRRTTTLHVRHAFMYISLPSLHGYDVKMPNCKFYRGRKQATTNLFFSL